MPQPPQLALSVAVCTQAPPQREKPASHTVPQPLFEQVGLPLAIAGQTAPHVPQFMTSLVGSAQLLPQRMKGSAH